MSLVSQELGANTLSASVTLSLGSFDSVTMSLETLVSSGVILLLYHLVLNLDCLKKSFLLFLFVFVVSLVCIILIFKQSWSVLIETKVRREKNVEVL